MSPKISIIIPILDDYDRLDACLDAICAQTYPLAEVEVLIVDNGTPAERIPELSKPGLEIVQLHESKPGSYCARNRALQVARGDLLVFTDSDCLPDPDWLEEGLEELARHKDGALVGGAIWYYIDRADAPDDSVYTPRDASDEPVEGASEIAPVAGGTP